jgi:hypothetical protein
VLGHEQYKTSLNTMGPGGNAATVFPDTLSLQSCYMSPSLRRDEGFETHGEHVYRCTQIFQRCVCMCSSSCPLKKTCSKLGHTHNCLHRRPLTYMFKCVCRKTMTWLVLCGYERSRKQTKQERSGLTTSLAISATDS